MFAPPDLGTQRGLRDRAVLLIGFAGGFASFGNHRTGSRPGPDRGRLRLGRLSRQEHDRDPTRWSRLA
ncbi:hypothetical protein CHELA1G2_21220 [Hyphomicrobiales bacterium]|nr:hypothetical protein CHELA1G2_21220 [Hyphomicrobiales bacterium]